MIARAFIRRDWRLLRTYRLAFASDIVSLLLFLASFALIDPVVRDDFAGTYGVAYASYVAVGVALTGTLLAAVSAFSEALRGEQVEGTLEPILLTPARHETLIVGMGVWPMVVAVIDAVLTLAVAALAGVAFDIAPLPALAVMAASIAAFLGFGLLAAAVTMVAKVGNPVTGFVGVMGSIAAGAYVPVDTYPGWLQRIADLNPLTHALDAWRASLLEGAGFLDVAGDVGLLLILAGVLTPLGWWALGRAVDTARRDGTLVDY